MNQTTQLETLYALSQCPNGHGHYNRDSLVTKVGSHRHDLAQLGIKGYNRSSSDDVNQRVEELIERGDARPHELNGNYVSITDQGKVRSNVYVAEITNRLKEYRAKPE